MNKSIDQHPLRLLFFSTVICTFSLAALAQTVAIQFYDVNRIAVAIGWCPFLSAFAGYPVICRYRIKCSSRFRWTVYGASLLGLSFALYFGLEQARINFPEEEIGTGIDTMLVAVFTGGLTGILTMLTMSQRAKYLISGKTNSWLQSYVTKTRIADPSGELTDDPWKVTDVLQHMQPTKKWFGTYAPTLFLDTVPDGEHCLCLQKADFRIFKRNQVFYRIDWGQVEEIRARYGEFRKTCFISGISSRGQPLLEHGYERY